MFDNLRADLANARRHNVGQGWFSRRLKPFLQPGGIAVLVYRFGSWARRQPMPVVRHGLVATGALVRFFVEMLTGVHISPAADIGPGFVVHTAYGVYVSPTKIGRNCVVQHGVVITYGVRSIGDNVYFGPGAKVIGNVRIGNNVLVAANSVVITNVADDMTVIGVPARIRWRRGGTLRLAGPAATSGVRVEVNASGGAAGATGDAGAAHGRNPGQVGS